MKSQSFIRRMGFALAGMRIVWKREPSFRVQCCFSLLAAVVVAAIRPGWLWAGLIALAVALLLALEMVNAAIEYMIDRLHPEIHDEIKHAKDAAAGAVLLASMFGTAIGLAMLADWWFS
jgi:diacylglycerol kinase (ATP)